MWEVERVGWKPGEGAVRTEGCSRPHCYPRPVLGTLVPPKAGRATTVRPQRTLVQCRGQHVWQGGEGGDVGAAPQLAHAQQRKALGVVVLLGVLHT